MKGTIVKAAEKLVISKFGIETWEKILKQSGFDIDRMFLIREDVDDNDVIKIIQNIGLVLNLSTKEVFDAYAKYWINDYIEEVYPSFKFKTAKKFITSIHEIHKQMAATVPDAKPPKFDYNWLSEKELVMTYHSNRNFIDLAIALLREIGIKYNEKFKIEKQDEKHLKITFLK